MSDKRTYIRVHDGMPEHPKVEALSDKGFRLLMELWCWCSRNHTDGRIPTAVWAKRATGKVRDEVTAAGLVEIHDGHVQMHDYLEHQRSADEIAEAIEKKRMGGVLGNHRRWHRNGVTDPGCEFCPPSGPADPDPPEDLSDNRSVSDRTTDSSRSRFGSPEDREQITEELEDSLRSSSSPRKRGTRIPADFDVTPEMINWARQNTPLVGRTETDRFLDYWRGVPGSRGTKLDWTATWRNWMRKAQDDATATSRGPGRRPNADDTIQGLLGATGSEGATILQLTRGDT